MALPFPTDPVTPSLPNPYFQDNGLVRGDLARDNNHQIWANSIYLNAAIAANRVQTVYSEVKTSGTAPSAQIPFDDTIPQNTEGHQLLTVSITPQSASSQLLVEAEVYLGEETNTFDAAVAALFRDNGVNAIATGYSQNTVSGAPPIAAGLGNGLVTVKCTVASGSVSATTFALRVGSDTSSTIRWNGVNGTRLFGGSLVSFLQVTEIQP